MSLLFSGGAQMSFDQSNTYTKEMEQQRQEKDVFFRSSPHSPIPNQERRSFAGLHYFPLDQEYRVTATIERFPDQQPVEMATSDGQRRQFNRFAFLQFVINGTPLRLTSYRPLHEHGEAELFVPFRDALAGKETYGAGRYLDIPFNDGDTTVVLDFNEAYNPFCAYNEAYSCPIPPFENALTYAIRAGERLYHQ
jgi:uncharacterized protein